MRKIFAFIGSPLKEKSNTCQITRMLLDRLAQADGGISGEIVTAGHVRLKYCTGCWHCMRQGGCPLDKTDGMGLLRQKMLEADFIILGSPVYTMSVTGQMKTFLDRMAAWYHTMRLAGKPGITVATTAGSGLEEVHQLLSMLLAAMGVIPVGKLETRGYFDGMLADRQAAESAAAQCAESILPYVRGERAPAANEYMEDVFQAMRHKSVDAREWLPADYAYWRDHNMLDVESFGELLRRLAGNKPAGGGSAMDRPDSK